MSDRFRSALEEICALAGGSSHPIEGAPRCDLGNSLPVVGARAWLTGKHHHDGPRDQANGLDAKKKTMGATERDEEARAAWREQQRLSMPTSSS